MIRFLPGTLALLAVLAFVGGCDGAVISFGTGDNDPPRFSSSDTVTVEENVSGPFYTAIATDPDGDRVRFSLSGSPDQDLFTIGSTSGELAFRDPPDFEAPADADGDNRYQVTLRASDGLASALLELTVTVVDVDQSAQLRRVASGFSEPLFVTELPDGSGRLAVAEKAGLVRLVDPSTGFIEAVPFLDVSADVSTDGERGLLGLAFSPNFGTDGEVYVNLTNLSGDTEIRRYTVFSTDTGQADPSTEDLILRVAQPFSNHNAGWLGFTPDGLMILPLGDGGGSNDPDDLAQDMDSLLGKVLRLDLSGDDFPGDPARDYAIPPDNPFAAGGGRPEIWASGLRNPYRASIDPATGDVFIGDVGQGQREEINRLRPSDGGANFGWALLEGTLGLKGSAGPGLTAPVAEYTHGSGAREGRSVTGGIVYRGPLEAFQGDYIFGDFISGNLWAVAETDLVPGSTVTAADFTVLTDRVAPDEGTLSNISSFGTDLSGHLYVVDFGGDLFRLEAD